MTSYLYSPSMPDEQRSLLRRCFTLAVEAFLLRFSGTQLAAWAGNPRAVSPCGQLPVPSTPVPVQQGALAHSNYSIDSRVRGTKKAAYHASLRPFLPTARSLILTHILQLGFMKQRERPGATVDWFTNTSMMIGFSGLPKKMWVRIRARSRGTPGREG